MALTGNEVSAVNQQRRIEELSKSPIGAVLESGSAVVGSVAALSTSLAASGLSGLAIAGSVVAGMGIVDWFRKLGTSKVSENLEDLGQATEDALSRVEKILRVHGATIDEIKSRLNSDEFRDAMASASLQALRTTQEKRLKRMALILANGVKDDDLTPDSTDDMMRAAVELKDADIALLGHLYKYQNHILTETGMTPGKWFSDIQSAHRQLVDSRVLDSREHLNYRSSYLRLESLGLVQAIPSINNLDGVGYELYALLMAGKKFYERLQEIAA
jgi:hypothetical protein